MCAIPINCYDWDWGESEEKNLSRLLYRICGSGSQRQMIVFLMFPVQKKKLFSSFGENPFRIFRHCVVNEKKSIVFPWILLSFRYDADLGRSRLVHSFCDSRNNLEILTMQLFFSQLSLEIRVPTENLDFLFGSEYKRDIQISQAADNNPFFVRWNERVVIMLSYAEFTEMKRTSGIWERTKFMPKLIKWQ